MDVNSADRANNIKKQDFYNLVSKVLSFVDCVDNNDNKTKSSLQNKNFIKKGDRK